MLVKVSCTNNCRNFILYDCIPPPFCSLELKVLYFGILHINCLTDVNEMGVLSNHACLCDCQWLCKQQKTSQGAAQAFWPEN